MKKSIHNWSVVISGISFCFLLFFETINVGCRKDTIKGTIDSVPNLLYGTFYLDNYGTSYLDNFGALKEIIVWRKPDSTEQQVKNWIKRIEKASGVNEPVIVSRACSTCDNSLMLLSGGSIEVYLNGHTVSGGQTPTSTSPAFGNAGEPAYYNGEDGPVYLSVNYQFNSNPLPSLPIPVPGNVIPPMAHTEQPVKVAVFDSGLDPGEYKSDYSYKSMSAPCINGADTGWNFIWGNNNVYDDHTSKHGTHIRRFITDQVDQNRNPIEILTVKTHDSSGIADLFNILCAFAYAKERNVNIINASFGFYGGVSVNLNNTNIQPDRNIKLLSKFIEYYLTKNNILLVCAAGNADSHYKLPASINGISIDPRNLNQVIFYPASLARNPVFSNIIAVTTVQASNGNGTVSPTQNYSSDIVDIGVIADTVSGNHYILKNSLLSNNEAVEGSSFAAAIVTGKLSANYYLYRHLMNSGTRIQKQDIIQILTASKVVSFNSSLANKIRNGIVMKK